MGWEVEGLGWVGDGGVEDAGGGALFDRSVAACHPTLE